MGAVLPSSCALCEMLERTTLDEHEGEQEKEEEEENEEEDEKDKAAQRCFTHTLSLYTPDTAHIFCHAPPYYAKPKRTHLHEHDDRPFLTLMGGDLVEGIPLSLDDCAHRYCHVGAPRFPNIDIEGKRVALHSFSQAKKLLLEHSDRDSTLWAAFNVLEIKHPRWWPGE